MSRSHAPSPHQDVGGRFMHDAKGAALAGSGTAYDPYPSYRHPPELESESDSEEGHHRGLDRRSTATPNRIVLSGDDLIVTGLDQTGPRVRFRSRVRISAGIGSRWRRRDGCSSNASSISGSPSSSISAPLRTHYSGSNNGWGPLGSRLKHLASQAAPVTSCQDDEASLAKGSLSVSGSGDGYARRRCARSSSWMLYDDADEHTRLLSATRRPYAGRYVYGSCHNDDSVQEQERWWREQLVDSIFGKWPGRLLNRHWWWWHLEPILCCLCELDEEE